MNRLFIFRLGVDLSMTVLMIVAMAYQITGNTIHEWVGMSLFVLFIVHNVFNRKWYKTILKAKYTARRMLGVLVNLLFLVSVAVILISSIPISADVFPYLSSSNDMMWRQIHVLTSYWGFIFMAVHIGLSWGMVLQAVRSMTGLKRESRIGSVGLRVLAVIIVIYGVQTSFEQDMGERLTIYNPFGGSNDSAMEFLMDYLAIMGIYIGGTHYTLKFLQKQKGSTIYKEMPKN